MKCCLRRHVLLACMFCLFFFCGPCTVLAPSSRRHRAENQHWWNTPGFFMCFDLLWVFAPSLRLLVPDPLQKITKPNSVMLLNVKFTFICLVCLFVFVYLSRKSNLLLCSKIARWVVRTNQYISNPRKFVNNSDTKSLIQIRSLCAPYEIILLGCPDRTNERSAAESRPRSETGPC